MWIWSLGGVSFPIIPPLRLHPSPTPNPLFIPHSPTPSFLILLLHPSPQLVHLISHKAKLQLTSLLPELVIADTFFRYPILRMLNMVNFHWTALVDFDDAVNFSHKEEASEEAHSTYNKIQFISFRWETKLHFQTFLSNTVISVETPCASLEAKKYIWLVF